MTAQGCKAHWRPHRPQLGGDRRLLLNWKFFASSKETPGLSQTERQLCVSASPEEPGP